MIYLATKHNSDEIHRFQVYKSALGWEATILGEKDSFISRMHHFEDVIYKLSTLYDSLTISKRIVDFNGKHIVLFDGEYYLLDKNGNILQHDFNNQWRVEFAPDGSIRQISPTLTANGTTLPNYYESAKPLCDDSILWYAKDIDTGLWVCFDSRNPNTPLSENIDQYTAIYEGLCKYHNSI